MSLTREELERRLKELDSRVWPEGQLQVVYLMSGQYRDLLQTALAAMDERDEAIQRGVSSAVALGKCQGERDALAAEGRLLREALEPAHRWLMRLVQSDNGRWVLNQRPDDADLAAMLAALSTPAPLITDDARYWRNRCYEIDEQYEDDVNEMLDLLREFVTLPQWHESKRQELTDHAQDVLIRYGVEW